MKTSSTRILRIGIILIGLIVLSVCIFALPSGIESEIGGDFDYGYLFVGMYVPAIPFFFALYQVLKLLSYVDKNKAFSKLSITALRNIKYSAFIVSALFVAGMPYIFYLADRDDAPGVAALGFVIIGTSFLIAVFAALAQKLFQNAVDIKSENDLTV